MRRETNGSFKLRFAGRRFASSALAVAMAGALTFSAIIPAGADTKSRASLSLTENQKIIHLLNRIGYGPRAGDVERVKKMGLDKYIDLQLHPERVDDPGIEARLVNFPSLRMSTAEIQRTYPPPNLLARELGLKQGKNAALQQPPGEGADENQKREYRQQVMAYYQEHGLKPPQFLLQELQGQKIIRAAYSERQLQEVMTDFWFNHFNIFWAKNLDRDLTTDYEMNVIRPNTMGKFKDLLMATAKSPAMLVYLDNFQSTSPDAQLPQRGAGQLQRRPGALGGLGNPRLGQQRANDPYYRQQQTDREMQRDQMRNQNPNPQQQAPLAGQPKRKPGINENYAREIMELHTLGVEGGYAQKDVQEVARCLTGWTVDRPRQSTGFVFRSFMHDNKEKTVLGQKIPAGGGIKDGEMVIDILAHHPSTAKFISTKLVRRFVSDTPPQALVDRVTAVYTKTDGDIREMLRTIFTSPEFNSKEAYRAKIKSPFELAISAIRALGADVNAPIQTAQFIAKMGEPLYLYQAPTGYPDRADQWVNTGSLLERLNFGLALTTNKLRGAAFDVKRAVGSIEMSDRQRVMERAIASLLYGDISTQTRSVLDKQLKEGVPVKGELGAVPPIPTGDEVMAGNSTEALPPTQGVGKGQKGIGNPERLERRFGLNAGTQIAMSADDLETAKVFGLVLGAPEFQRR